MGRVGLVLGAGGAVGHAYHAGVLAALRAELGWDARRADVVVGTSAGSLAGAMLRAGLSPDDLAARARGRPMSAEGERILAGVALGPPPSVPAPRPAGARPSSPSRLLRAVTRPWQATPGSVAAALLPLGTRTLDPLPDALGALFRGGWPAAPLWVNAVDLDTGARVTFGREGAPDAPVGAAVAASCAIPAWFVPVEIGGRRYVDGGVHSPTNADVLVDAGVDLVLVSSPMSTARGALRPAPDAPVRGAFAVLLAAEVARLRAAGALVVTFAPDADDRDAMVGNPLDPAKRAPVCEQVLATTRRRLRDPRLRARLALLG